MLPTRVVTEYEFTLFLSYLAPLIATHIAPEMGWTVLPGRRSKLSFLEVHFLGRCWRRCANLDPSGFLHVLLGNPKAALPSSIADTDL